MKHFAFILLIASIFSCKTVERIVTVTETVVERDSVPVEKIVPIEVPVYLKGDTVYAESDTIIQYVDKPLNVDPIFAYGTLAWGKAGIINSRLYMYVYEVDTLLQVKYDALVKTYNVLITKKTKTTTDTTQIKTKNNGFARFAINWFFLSVVLIAAGIAFYFYNIGRR